MATFEEKLSQSTKALRSINPDKEVFTHFNMDEQTFNPRSLAKFVNLRSINWGFRRAGTLIAPEVIVYAQHFKAAAKGQFYGTSPVEFEIAEGQRKQMSNSDVEIARLTKPVVGVTPYQILGSLAEGVSVDIIVTDSERKAWFGEGSKRQKLFSFTTLDENLVSGDSGHPIFVVDLFGAVLLIGCHFTTGNASFLGAHQAEIEDQCRQWGVEPPVFFHPEPVPDGTDVPPAPVATNPTPEEAKVLARFGLEIKDGQLFLSIDQGPIRISPVRRR